MGVGRAPICLTEHVYGLSNAHEYAKKIKNTADFDRQKLQRCYIIAISVCQINVAWMEGRYIMRNITIKLWNASKQTNKYTKIMSKSRMFYISTDLTITKILKIHGMNQEYEDWVSWQKPFWKNILKLKINLLKIIILLCKGKTTVITVVERQASIQNPHICQCSLDGSTVSPILTSPGEKSILLKCIPNEA